MKGKLKTINFVFAVVIGGIFLANVSAMKKGSASSGAQRVIVEKDHGKGGDSRE